jgi:hypothetical protein
MERAEKKPAETSELTQDEINNVTGGAGPKPKSPPAKAFEIKDFSFGVEIPISRAK